MPDWVEVILDRESLNAGDDAVSHGQRWMFPAVSTIYDLVIWIAGRYVPRLPGVHHWELFMDSDNTHEGWIPRGSTGWPHRGCPLGVLYTHTHDVGPVEELKDKVSLYLPGHWQLGGLARSARLEVTAGHTYGNPAEPLEIGTIYADSSFEGGRPIRVD
ncbi:hypothetical protein IU427_17930 [Nocardia beijingensis]|uniref:hypothetical protein n=1 Tax=Nocardia beijingensis TaxID=95162 RepID=UPI0018959A65|nr:hypothetical protein [Nocardia beijingensis]MBF6467047.1 hypothetical protein [Nocardia beijingensis]